MEPKVSIIITTFNRSSVLPNAVISVFNQTYSDFELLIVDDCSEDDTRRVIDGFDDSKIRYFRTSVNSGSSVARNLGINNARGKYIVFLDDDNELDPEFLAETVTALEASTDFAVNTGRLIKHDGFIDYAPAFRQTGHGFTAIDWGWLIKREVFDKIRYDPEMKGDDDADFGIQFYKYFSSTPVDKPLQTANAKGMSVTFASKNRIESLRKFVAKNWKEYEKAGPKDLSFLYRFTARNLYQAGLKREAIQYFKRAFLVYKNRRTLIHYLVSFISYGAYYKLMRLEERYYSRLRRKTYGI